MSKQDFKVYISHKKEAIIEIKNAENAKEASEIATRWWNENYDDIDTSYDRNIYSSEGINKIYSELYPETDYNDLVTDVVINAETGEEE